MSKELLETKDTLHGKGISRTYAYELKEIEKGQMIPMVSDTMFSCINQKKNYICHFISDFFNFDYDKLYQEMNLIQNRLDQKSYYDSKKTVDLVFKYDNKIFNVELNNNGNISRLERNNAYIGNLYESNMKRGSSYDYSNVIQVNINNFCFKGVKKSYQIFELKERIDNTTLTNKITIIYIYLPNIRKKLYNEEGLEEWEKVLLVTNEEDSEPIKEIIRGNKKMEEYRKQVYEYSTDDEIIGLYNKELEDERLHNIELNKRYENGKKESCIEIARNLLKNNIDINIISNVTNLSIEEINKIKISL